MNRKVLTALLLLFIAGILFAGGFQNAQKIFPVDSDIADAIGVLYLEEGLTLPSSTAPYSRAELLKMLTKLDPERMNGQQSAVYDYILSVLEPDLFVEDEDGVSFVWGFNVNLEAYLQSNPEEGDSRDKWVRGFNEQKPCLAFSFETWPGDNFYGYFEFSFGNTFTLENGFAPTLSSNLPFIPPAVFADLDVNFPYRAFGAAGGKCWSLELGRDRMSWGPGVSGNLLLGDNLKYHNLLRFTAFGRQFKYTFATSFFPHPSNYIGDGDGDCTLGLEHGDPVDGIHMFMAHRLEWRSFGDRLNITLTESIMYQSEDNLLDLRTLSLCGLYHNNYTPANANSLLSLEVEFTPARNLNIYLVGVVDEFALPSEARPSASVTGNPDALGFMAGVKYQKVLDGGLVFISSFEAVYTDPWLYLRASQKGEDLANYDQYGLNYVVAIREFTQSAVRYNSSFLGYKYGPDAIAVNFNAGLRMFGRWSVETNAFYMLHGTHDMFTAWSRCGGGSGYASPNVHSPTSSHESHNYNDPDAESERNAVSRTLIIGSHGTYRISDHFTAFGQVDFISIRNYKNISGQTSSDLQLTIGVSYVM